MRKSLSSAERTLHIGRSTETRRLSLGSGSSDFSHASPFCRFVLHRTRVGSTLTGALWCFERSAKQGKCPTESELDLTHPRLVSACVFHSLAARCSLQATPHSEEGA